MLRPRPSKRDKSFVEIAEASISSDNYEQFNDNWPADEQYGFDIENINKQNTDKVTRNKTATKEKNKNIYVTNDHSIHKFSNKSIDVQKINIRSSYTNTENRVPFPSRKYIPTENSDFEGFCIDVLQQISKMVGFDYKIKLVPDGKYGVYDFETGEWNGIVRELVDKVTKDIFIDSPRICGIRSVETIFRYKNFY